MGDAFFSGAFLVTLALAAVAWMAGVTALVRLSRPAEGGLPAPMRRVLGIEIAWTLVPAALVIGLAVRVLAASR